MHFFASEKYQNFIHQFTQKDKRILVGKFDLKIISKGVLVVKNKIINR